MPISTRLFDVITRHEIYLERVKNYEASQYNVVLQNLSQQLRIIFSKVEYATLDGLTKIELQSLLSAVKKVQTKLYSKYSLVIIDQLKQFMNAETEVSKAMMLAFTIQIKTPQAAINFEPTDVEFEDEIKDKKNNFFPFWYFKNNKSSQDALWSKLINTHLPATGSLPLDFLNTFNNQSFNAVLNVITKGYANKTPVNEILNQIIGTKAKKYSDGQFATMARNNRTVTNTIVKHISSIVSAGVASQLFDYYEWISILDGRTSDICRSRANNVYLFGKGPLPPAHGNCRSSFVPVPSVGMSFDEPTLSDWMAGQPLDMVTDLLGAVRGAAYRAGRVKAADLGSFLALPPLTPAQFKGKLASMLSQ